MKILIATSHRNIVGGVETYLQTVIPALLERGHRVGMLYDYVADPAKPTVDPEAEELPVWFGDQFEQRPELWRQLVEWAPDAVYSQGIGSAEIDRELQKTFPVVRFMHGYWGTCATGRKCHAAPHIQACRRTFGPMCLALHYPRRCGGLNPFLAWKMFKTERTNNSLLGGYRAVLVASAHMQSEFQRHGVPEEKLHVVHLPLPDSTHQVTALPKTPGGTLLFAGRLTDVKGVDFLIRAVPEAQTKLGRKLVLIVAGDGPELDHLRELADREGIAAEFRGWLSHSEKMDLMERVDLLVMPSVWPEPFGLVGIEAGSRGLPAAGFASGGIPDWLIPGETGELAPADPPTTVALADAITRALADPGHYNDLRRGALAFSRRFTLTGHIAELEAILEAHAGSPAAQNGGVLTLQNGHQ
jgi:glycosyltransferase involved in cell wall biosynthesis